MMIWIFVEIAMMSEYSWLQSLYFGVGVSELAIVCVLLGILDPRQPNDFAHHQYRDEHRYLNTK